MFTCRCDISAPRTDRMCSWFTLHDLSAGPTQDIYVITIDSFADPGQAAPGMAQRSCCQRYGNGSAKTLVLLLRERTVGAPSPPSARCMRIPACDKKRQANKAHDRAVTAGSTGECRLRSRKAASLMAETS